MIGFFSHRHCIDSAAQVLGTMGPNTVKNSQIYNSHFGTYSLLLNEKITKITEFLERNS